MTCGPLELQLFQWMLQAGWKNQLRLSKNIAVQFIHMSVASLRGKLLKRETPWLSFIPEVGGLKSICVEHRIKMLLNFGCGWQQTIMVGSSAVWFGAKPRKLYPYLRVPSISMSFGTNKPFGQEHTSQTVRDTSSMNLNIHCISSAKLPSIVAFLTVTTLVSDPTYNDLPVGVDFYHVGEHGNQFGPFGSLYPAQKNNITGVSRRVGSRFPFSLCAHV